MVVLDGGRAARQLPLRTVAQVPPNAGSPNWSLSVNECNCLFQPPLKCVESFTDYSDCDEARRFAWI